ncbi:hypothetical protein VPH35_115353 [Triticum aestivum]
MGCCPSITVSIFILWMSRLQNLRRSAGQQHTLIIPMLFTHTLASHHHCSNRLYELQSGYIMVTEMKKCVIGCRLFYFVCSRRRLTQGYILVTEMKRCVDGCRLFYFVCSSRRLTSMHRSAVKRTCRNSLLYLSTCVYHLVSMGTRELA